MIPMRLSSLPFSPFSRTSSSTHSTCFPLSPKTSNSTQFFRNLRHFSKALMGSEELGLIQKRKLANFRLANVSGLKTNLIEIHSQDPKFHVVFIPGNPGVISFYTAFLESVYEFLGGNASITAIGYISHSDKDWESGRLFSLQDQIEHKINFIEQEYQDTDAPIVLVGHSIGAYMSLEIFKRSLQKVTYCICLYPFLAVDPKCLTQSFIRRIAESTLLSSAVSSIAALLGMLPIQIPRFIVKKSIGKSWSPSAIDSLCTHVLRYHTMRNVLYLTMHEFRKLAEKPDWDFIRGKKNQIAFLFGDDDHWGPLHMYEEILREVPGAFATVEREGHTHAFSCSDVGSTWGARHVSGLMRNYTNLFEKH